MCAYSPKEGGPNGGRTQKTHVGPDGTDHVPIVQYILKQVVRRLIAQGEVAKASSGML